jgi:dolichol kinase
VAWLIFVWVIGLSGTSLFILGAATGLVFAPIFPLSFGFFNQKLNVVPMLIALLLCGSALGALLFQKVAGKRLLKEEEKKRIFSEYFF